MTRSDPVLKTIRRAPAGVRIVMFPYAGSGAYATMGWLPFLPATIELCAMQRAGREDRIYEPSSTSLAACVRESVDALAAVTDRPYALYGHSLGGFLAYHTALSVQRVGLRPPECIFISGIGPEARADGYGTALAEYARLVGRQLIADGNADRFDDETLTEMWRHGLAAYEHDLHLYFHRDIDGPWPPLRVPIHAFYGAGDASATRDAMLEWGRYTTHPLVDVEVDGDHMFIEGAGREVVARHIVRYIEALAAHQPDGASPFLTAEKTEK